MSDTPSMQYVCPYCEAPIDAEAVRPDGVTDVCCASCGMTAALDEDGREADVTTYEGTVDDHTGISDEGGVPSCYEHVETFPEPEEVYRVVTAIDYVDRPIHRNIQFLPGELLNAWLEGHNFGPDGERVEYGGEIVDIRPVSWAEAEAEMVEYGSEGQEVADG